MFNSSIPSDRDHRKVGTCQVQRLCGFAKTHAMSLRGLFCGQFNCRLRFACVFFWGGNKKNMCEILSDLVYLVYLVLGTTYEVFCQTLFEDDWRNSYRNLIVLDDKTVATWRCSLKSSPLEDVHKLRAHGDISPQWLHNLLHIHILLKNYSTRGDQVFEQLMRKQELL